MLSDKQVINATKVIIGMMTMVVVIMVLVMMTTTLTMIVTITMTMVITMMLIMVMIMIMIMMMTIAQMAGVIDGCQREVPRGNSKDIRGRAKVMTMNMMIKSWWC